ncbi:MAG: hypothetical protein R6U39_07085 [Candidatus Aegiribacteria sp.]
MPAFILLLRIKKVVIPLPWFLVWLLAAPFALAGWLLGNMGLIFFPGSYAMRVLSQAWRLVLFIMTMHGTEIRIESKEEDLLIEFI